MKRRAKRITIAAALLAAALGVLVYLGPLRPSVLLARRYPVRGVDVSQYQGEIDWPALAPGLRFAFVKATEGSGHVDPYFEANFRGTAEAGLAAGAYHFFSFDSPGETQARSFIQAAGDLSGRLPPVVDVELYGAHRRNPPGPEAVRAILDPLLAALEARYGAKPILYATGASYELYLKDAYAGYPLWIREVYLAPRVPFLFWQFSDRGRLPGYRGPERYIDLNAFSGSEEELRALILP